MILREIHLTHFGDYQGRSVSGFEAGLNLVHGGNEAGKSTLLGALRFGLFGSAYKGHEPAEGKRCVELLLDRKGAEWRLTRRQGTARSAFRLEPSDGGAAVSLEEFAHEWLDGMSLTRYANVYALGLGELAWGTDVRDMLLDAGFGEQGRRLREAISETGAAADALFRPSAGRPLNKALGDRENALQDERKCAARPRELDAAEEEARSKQAAVDALDAELLDLGRRLEAVRMLLGARGQWDALGALDHQIAALAHVTDFAASAPDAYSRAEEEYAGATRAASEAADAARAAQAELDHLRVEDCFLEHAEEVAELALAAERAFDLPEQLREAERQADQAREGARQEALRGCGPQADPAVLAALDASAPVVDALQARMAEMDRARRGLEQAEEKERGAREAVTEATREESEARRALEASPAPPNVQTLQQRRQWCEELGRAAERRATAAEHLRGLRERREKDEAARKSAREQQEALDRRRAEGEKVGGSGSGRPARLALFAVGMLLLVGGIVLVAMQQMVGGVGLLAGGVVVLVAGALLPASAVIIPRIEIALPPVTVSDAEIRAAEERVAACGAECDRLAAEVLRIAREAGLAPGAATQQAQALLALLDRQIPEATAAHSGRARLEADLARVTQDRAKCEAALKAASAAATDARRAAEETGARWRQWLAERGLPADLGPEAAGAYLEGVRAVQGSLLSAARAEAKARDLRERLEQLRERVGVLAGRLGTALEPDDPWGIAGARAWAKSLAEARQADLRRGECRKRLAEATGEETRQSEAAEQAAARMAEILRQAGARDKDDLLQRAGDAERLRELRAERQQKEASIRGARDDAAWEAFQEALRAADWAGAQAESETLDREMAEKRAARDGLLKAIGQVKKRIEEMQTESALAEAQARVQDAEAQIRRHARAWAGQAAAHALLVLTRSLFERDRQPEAVRRAGEMFGQITGGKWGGVVSFGDSIKVVGAAGTGVERETELLSRGAREALFLCARLAAIERAVERCPLPVALDDVLVNLDPERRRRALGLVAGLAAKTQVLLFTCHPTVVDEARACGAPCTVVSV